jgi:hypothetical protein
MAIFAFGTQNRDYSNVSIGGERYIPRCEISTYLANKILRIIKENLTNTEDQILQ